MAISTSLLTGCLRTELINTPIPERTFLLAASNSRPISLQVKYENPSETLGRQFMFGVIPWGRVTASRLPEFVGRRAYERLTLRGLRPLTAQMQTPVLTLEIDAIEAWAYDLIFIRRVSCTVRMRAIYRECLEKSSADSSARTSWGSSPETCARVSERSGHNSDFIAYAFADTLSRVLSQTIDETVDYLLDEVLLDEVLLNDHLLGYNNGIHATE